MALQFMHMHAHLLIKEGIHQGYRWTICHNDRGYYCAYILLENSHPWSQYRMTERPSESDKHYTHKHYTHKHYTHKHYTHKHYTQIPCPVHGGITYMESDIQLKFRVSIHEIEKIKITSYTDSTSPNYIPIDARTGKPLSALMHINPRTWIGWDYAHALDAPNIDLIITKSILPMSIKEILIQQHKKYSIPKAKEWTLDIIETECQMACESAYLAELKQKIESVIQ